MATFRELPEIRGDFAPQYLENGKAYEQHPGDASLHVLRLQDAMLIFSVGLKGKATASAPKVYSKKTKICSFRGVNNPFLEKFKIVF